MTWEVVGVRNAKIPIKYNKERCQENRSWLGYLSWFFFIIQHFFGHWLNIKYVITRKKKKLQTFTQCYLRLFHCFLGWNKSIKVTSSSHVCLWHHFQNSQQSLGDRCDSSVADVLPPKPPCTGGKAWLRGRLHTWEKNHWHHRWDLWEHRCVQKSRLYFFCCCCF